jgi:hypothetical protein
MSTRFLNHLQIQIIKGNEHLAKFLANTEDLSQDDIDEAISTCRKNHTAIMVAQFGKSIGKKILLAGKDFASNFEKLSYVSNFLQPELINTQLSEEEYFAILDNCKNKASTPQHLHPALLIARNMAIDMFTENIKSFIQTQVATKVSDKSEQISRALEKIYQQNLQFEPEHSNQDQPMVDTDQDQPIMDNQQFEPIMDNQQFEPMMDNQQFEPIMDNHQQFENFPMDDQEVPFMNMSEIDTLSNHASELDFDAFFPNDM